MATITATTHIGLVWEYGGYLSKKQQDIYWTLAAKIIFVRCFLQPNLDTDIELLTTRVNQPNIYNYKKLACCVRYIRDKMDMTLIIKASNTSLMRWWIEVAYGSNPYIKSHSGVIMSLGKEDMNRKLSESYPWISTESEIVGVNNSVFDALWRM